MANVVIRNLPDEVHRALRAQASANGRSTEAEIRLMLTEGVRRRRRVLIGTELQRFGQRLGGVDLEIQRNQTLVAPADFE
jgi:plasmid stability protein